MTFQVCHFHADEAVTGVPLGDGTLSFTCERSKGHPTSGSYSWLGSPETADGNGSGGLADELGLAVELPAALSQYRDCWVEYGVVERAYALSSPDDFAQLVEQYGHTAIHAARYTTSSFLARALGDLSRTGAVAFHSGPATGRWSYNSTISWWSLFPEPEWSQRLSWADSGHDMSYVPGSVEDTAP